MNLLVPGGAGYIGSHMVKYLQDRDHEVVVLDDFSTGHEWAIKTCEVLRVNLLDQERLARSLKGKTFDGVINFAAKSLVEESTRKPDLYYHNNFLGTLNLVNEMLRNNINNLVFSSTASIFGNPVSAKIDEDHPKNPINPYGKSKLMVEEMLRDMCSAYELNAVCFRYFNAAGADESGTIGEAHNPETHLIPNILKSLLSDGQQLKVFGNDYDTPDGTCVRDYVHVTDLVQAHFLGLKKLKNTPGFSAYNLGNGTGFSVLDVINTCEQIVEEEIEYVIDSKRVGDPAVLMADSSKVVRELGWEPQFNDLSTIVQTAWKWHQSEIEV